MATEELTPEEHEALWSRLYDRGWTPTYGAPAAVAQDTAAAGLIEWMLDGSDAAAEFRDRFPDDEVTS